MNDKKYLFVLDLSVGRDFADSVVESFMRRAFFTNSVLVLFAAADKTSVDYVSYTKRKIFGGGQVKLVYLFENQVDAVQLVKQVDYVIAGGTVIEQPILNFALQNNIKILPVTTDVDAIFKDIPIPVEIENVRKNLLTALESGLFLKCSPQEFEIFLFHEGLGESTAFLFWLKKFRETCGKKILCICANNLRAELLSTSPYVDAIVKVDWLVFDFISVYFAKKYNIHPLLLAHFDLKTLAARAKLSADEVKTYGQIGLIRDFLNIGADKKFERYAVQIPPPIRERVKNLFAQMNLIEGKTVFVVTQGYNFGGLNHHLPFWIKLRDKLNAAGYEVITNGDKEDIPNCRNVFLSLLESAAFAGLCGNIVSIPTGFVEVICAINSADKINLQVMFPNENDIYWRGQKIDVEQRIGNYVYSINPYFAQNINFSCDKWGNTGAEEDLIISKIVQKMDKCAD